MKNTKLSTIDSVIAALKAGRKVRKKCWSESWFLYMDECSGDILWNNGKKAHMSLLTDFKTDAWEEIIKRQAWPRALNQWKTIFNQLQQKEYEKCYGLTCYECPFYLKETINGTNCKSVLIKELLEDTNKEYELGEM